MKREGIRYLIYNRALLQVESVQFEMSNLGRDKEAAGLEELTRDARLLWSGDGVTVYRLAD